MDNSTAALLGQLVGGIVGVYMMAVIWEFFLFKRVMNDPAHGKLASAIAGYLTASIVYGFLSANGGAFNPSGFATYLLGFGVIAFFGTRRGLKLRDQSNRDAGLEETFG